MAPPPRPPPRSSTPTVEGPQGMFKRLLHALTSAKDRHVLLTANVNKKLHTWGCLLAILEIRPTHLREITPFTPSWFGATYAYWTGMGGVCWNNSGKWFMCWDPFYAAMQNHLISFDNPCGDVTTNNLELGALLA